MSYNEIENEFRLKHPNGKFIKRYIILTIVLITILTILKINIWVKILFSTGFQLLIMYAFICKKMKLKIWKENPWRVLTKQLDDLAVDTGNRNKEVIKEILRNRNLLTKEKLKEMREYYSNNVEKPAKLGMFEKITGISSIAISIYFSVNAKEDIIQHIIDGFAIILSIVVVLYFLQDLKDIREIVFDKYDVNDIFERALSEIYLEL